MNPRIIQALNDCLDAAMPGRRVGSTPPKDWTAEAAADVERLYAMLPFGLGISSVRQFCTANGLPADEGYAMTFRTLALKRRLREESAALMPTIKPKP